jgi:poly(rC)-binding protein 3/4
VAHEKKNHDLCFGSTEKKEILKFALIFGKVIIFGREQLDEPLPPAMDALLRVYQQTINNDSLDVGPDNVIVRRILAPSEQAASLLIGEHGVMINSIMEASQTDIRVLGNLI